MEKTINIDQRLFYFIGGLLAHSLTLRAYHKYGIEITLIVLGVTVLVLYVYNFIKTLITNKKQRD